MRLGDRQSEAVGEILDLGPGLARVERRDDMDALAPRQHRPARQPHFAEHVVQLMRGGADLVEAQSFVGIEIEDETIGLLDIGDLRSPAVQLDRAHLDAGEQALGIVDIEIGLVMPILLADRDVLHGIAEAAGVMLLEEALLGAPLRAADEADRTIGQPFEDRIGEAGVIIGELPLGDAAFGVEHAIAAADRHRRSFQALSLEGEGWVRVTRTRWRRR